MKLIAEIDTAHILRAWKEIGQRGARKVSVQAINRAIKPEVGRIRKDVAESLTGVTQRSLKGRFKVVKAHARNVSAALYMKAHKLRWPKLRVAKLKRGVNFAGTHKPSAFFAVMKTGHQGYWERVGPGSTPIRELGLDLKPAIEKAFRRSERRVLKSFGDLFPPLMQKEAEKVMAKAKAKRGKRFARGLVRILR